MELTTNCGRSDGTVRSVRDIDPRDPNPRFIAPFEADTGQPRSLGSRRAVRVAQHARLRNRESARSGRPCSTMAPAIRRRRRQPERRRRGRHGAARATRKASPAGFRQTPAAPGISCRCRPISRTVTSPASPSIPWTPAAEPSTSASTASRDAGSKVRAQASAICGKRRTAARHGPMSAAICRTCRSTTSCSGGTSIVVATDLGVVVSSNGGTTWSRLGGNLPYTTTLDVHLGPDDRIYAATHGRGIWSLPKP